MIRQQKIIRNKIEIPFHCKQYIRREKVDRASNIHYHDYIEAVFCLSGDCNCIVGNRTFKVSEGEMLLIPSNAPHEVGMHDEWTTYVVLRFLPSVLFSWSQTAPEYSNMFSLLQNLGEFQLFFPKEEIKDYPFSFLFKNMAKEWGAKKIGYDICMRAHILELFMHVIRIWEKRNSELIKKSMSNEINHLLQAAISFVEANFIDVDRDSCAKAIGVSPSYLSKLFTSELKISFTEYVNMVKLKEAEKLLLTTDKSITEISFSAGFASTAYFISLFKAKHRLTPLKYRNSVEA